MIASEKNRLEILKLLIKNGASIREENNNNDTALSIAVSNNHSKICEELLKHYDTNELESIGNLLKEKIGKLNIL